MNRGKRQAYGAHSTAEPPVPDHGLARGPSEPGKQVLLPHDDRWLSPSPAARMD